MATEAVTSSEVLWDVDADILLALLDHPQVGVVLPTRNNSIQVPCQVGAGIFPSLEILLQPLQLTADEINLSGECVLFCEKLEGVLIARARIIENVDNQQIRVELTTTEKKDQQREFFRVDADVSIDCWKAGTNPQDQNRGRLQRVNLSGSGLRFATELALKKDDLLQIALDFPGSQFGNIKAIGRVVRLFESGSASREVAVELFGIEETTQDKIVKFCTIEQTRQIRMKVQLRE